MTRRHLIQTLISCGLQFCCVVGVSITLVACGENTDPSPKATSKSSAAKLDLSPTLWNWNSTYLDRSASTFALFDDSVAPSIMLVGHLLSNSNLPTSMYAFEVSQQENTLHLRSFGSFQPHAKCIAGDFEFDTSDCTAGADFPRCARLIDLESRGDLTMHSYPRWNVTVPVDWEWKYSKEQTLGQALGKHINLNAMRRAMPDKIGRADRERQISKFLRLAFDVRANLPSRLAEPRVANRQCNNSGKAILYALTGRKNFQYIGPRLPPIPNVQSTGAAKL